MCNYSSQPGFTNYTLIPHIVLTPTQTRKQVYLFCFNLGGEIGHWLENVLNKMMGFMKAKREKDLRRKKFLSMYQRARLLLVTPAPYGERVGELWE